MSADWVKSPCTAAAVPPGRLNLCYGCGRAFVAVGVVADDGSALTGQFQGDALADSAVVDAGYERFLAGKRPGVAHFATPASVRC